MFYDARRRLLLGSAIHRRRKQIRSAVPGLSCRGSCCFRTIGTSYHISVVLLHLADILPFIRILRAHWGIEDHSSCDLASSPSSPFFPFQPSLPRNHPSAAHARGSPPDYWTQIHVLMQHQASSFPSRLKYLGTRHRLRCDHILCR